MRRAALLTIAGLLLPASGEATMLANWSLDDVLSRADLVVIGTIGSQRSVRVNGRMLTESVVQVDRTLLGTHAPRVVLWQLGGRDGDLVTDVVGTARLVPGRRMLLITRQAEDGRRYLVGMALGAYEMDGERLSQVIDASLVDRDGTVLAAPAVREAFLADVIEALPRSKGGQPGTRRPVTAPRKSHEATEAR